MNRLGKTLWLQFLLLFGTSEALPATGAGKVIIAQSAVVADVLPLWIAKEQKFFDKYGLQAEVVLVKSTPMVVSALLSGDVQMGNIGGVGVVGAAGGGADLKVVASFYNKPILRVIARPEIEKTEDLKGKRLGVQSIGGAGWLQAMLALEQLGLDPSRDDIRVLQTGASPVRVQALEAKSIDFTVFSDMSFVLMLKQRGFRLLAEIPPVPVAGLGIAVDRGYIQRHGDVLENALKALAEGIAFALSTERKGPTIELMMKHLKVRSDAAEESYKELPRTLERKPYVSIEGMQNIQRLMKLHNTRVAKIDVRELVDNSILQKLDQSGFLDRLHATYGLK
ncbi:MAG: ABC transporter substrate-binding protein [Deltaproteobacteria bacterium]|nr:ABC transporter substrate-binding protein [Deltaproteobacteria bacterium]MBI2228823.1 ABC transporter substrate-binding protein [Deltaproteobacteria bacterium]